jgi:hypothetical protein
MTHARQPGCTDKVSEYIQHMENEFVGGIHKTQSMQRNEELQQRVFILENKVAGSIELLESLLCCGLNSSRR